MISIPSGKVATREEFMKDMIVINANQNLLIVGDAKPLRLNLRIENFVGARA